jgi:hypothetical protein
MKAARIGLGASVFGAESGAKREAISGPETNTAQDKNPGRNRGLARGRG